MLQLRSPKGNPIIGTLDIIEGTANVDGWDPAIPGDGDAPKVFCDKQWLSPVYSGQTDMDWDSQKPKERQGEILVVDSGCEIFRIGECTVFDDGEG